MSSSSSRRPRQARHSRGSNRNSNSYSTHPKSVPLKIDHRPYVLLLCGLPGSGKSDIARGVVELDDSFVRINQEELKTRAKCERAAERALQDGNCPVIDRCNFDITQRGHFVKIAKKVGVPINCVMMTTAKKACITKYQDRKKNDPKHSNKASSVVHEMYKDWKSPNESEGFNGIECIDGADKNAVDSLVAKLAGRAEIVAPASQTSPSKKPPSSQTRCGEAKHESHNPQEKKSVNNNVPRLNTLSTQEGKAIDSPSTRNATPINDSERKDVNVSIPSTAPSNDSASKKAPSSPLPPVDGKKQKGSNKPPLITRPSTLLPLKLDQRPYMILLCGLPGSGKSTLGRRLVDLDSSFVRANQDELKKRPKVESAAKRALKEGKCPIIDRCNFDVSQRHHFVKIAQEFKVPINCVMLMTPKDECIQRVQNRTNHETLPPHQAVRVINMICKDWVPPSQAEGFHGIECIDGTDDAALDTLIASLVHPHLTHE